MKKIQMILLVMVVIIILRESVFAQQSPLSEWFSNRERDRIITAIAGALVAGSFAGLISLGVYYLAKIARQQKK